MAKIVKITNDGARTETEVLHVGSFRESRERFLKMKANDQEMHMATFEDLNVDSYMYSDGMTKVTIKLILIQED